MPAIWYIISLYCYWDICRTHTYCCSLIMAKHGPIEYIYININKLFEQSLRTLSINKVKILNLYIKLSKSMFAYSTIWLPHPRYQTTKRYGQDCSVGKSINHPIKVVDVQKLLYVYKNQENIWGHAKGI